MTDLAFPSRTFLGPWWTLPLRGALAILFGVLTLVLPGLALLTLVVLFGIYALADGISLLIAAFHRHRAGEPPRGVLAFGAVLSLGLGVLTLLVPAVTAIALLYLIAAWAMISGVVLMITAIRLRKEIQGEWLLALSGILSAGLGVLFALFPGTGALALAIWIGAYAIVFGVLLVALGFKLRSWTAGAGGAGQGMPAASSGATR